MAKRIVLIGSLILLLDLVVLGGWWMTRDRPATVATSSAPGSASPGLQVKSTRQAIEDPLSWRVVSSYTARQIENQYLPFKARGIYVIMKVAATNGASHSVLVKADLIKLKLGRAVYPLNVNALSGLELAGRKPIAGLDLKATTTTTGWVVFDVPPSAIASTPELCLDEACPPQPE